jgi:cysteinyl-tRNA synthetase
MCDDLNTSVALASALEGTRVIFREGGKLNAASGASAKRYLDQVNALLGIVRHEGEQCSRTAGRDGEVDSDWIERLIAERAEAKASKDFGRADEIRRELEARGIEVKDTPEGTTWRAKSAV